MSYDERPSALEGATVWTRVADGSASSVLPDGCMDLIWDGDAVIVAGPDTGPHVAWAAAGTSFVALRFQSGIGPAVLGVPAHAVRDQRLLLADVAAAALGQGRWGRDDVARIEERLHAAAHPVDVLEAVATERLGISAADPIARPVLQLIDAGRSVAEIAVAVGLSERQLHRRSLVAFGYGPKVLTRILRLQRALLLVRRGRSFAAAAAEAGYADQAHLAREGRALTGGPLSALALPVVPTVEPADHHQSSVGSSANRSTPMPSGSSNDA